MVQHVIHRDRQRIVLALHDDPEGISDQDRLDPSLFDDSGKERIIRRDDYDLFPVSLALSKLRNGHDYPSSAFVRISGSRSIALIAIICTPSQ